LRFDEVFSPNYQDVETSYTPDWKTLHQYQLCTDEALLCGRL
jgi:hypothetical protein